MNVVAVDDELISLDCLEIVLSSMEEIEKVTVFSNAKDTINWFKKNKADVAFLDIEMWGMNGLTLAAEIRRLCSSCKIIFVTSSPQYAVEAFQLHVSGYIVKPVTQQSIRKELDFVKETDSSSVQETKSDRIPKNSLTSNLLKVQCFGNFEVFQNNKPVKFSLTKSKELLAYLVHRKGSACSISEIAVILYEDKPDNAALQSQIRNIISDLKKSLAAAGYDDILVKTRGYVSILPEKISCDYYDFLDGIPAAVNAYSGEYMAQYSWAEFTVGYLERKLR